jgi:hypothetical protein
VREQPLVFQSSGFMVPRLSNPKTLIPLYPGTSGWVRIGSGTTSSWCLVCAALYMLALLVIATAYLSVSSPNKCSTLFLGAYWELLQGAWLGPLLASWGPCLHRLCDKTTEAAKPPNQGGERYFQFLIISPFCCIKTWKMW